MDIDWMQIGAAAIFIMMFVYVWPRAMHMIKNSPKPEPGDWTAFLLPIAAVVAFVMLLMSLV